MYLKFIFFISHHCLLIKKLSKKYQWHLNVYTKIPILELLYSNGNVVNLGNIRSVLYTSKYTVKHLHKDLFQYF